LKSQAALLENLSSFKATNFTKGVNDMTIKRRRKPSQLTKKAQRGFRGYPVATVAFYGPDDKTASKVVVSIVNYEGDDEGPMEKWFSDEDARYDGQIGKQIAELLRRHKVVTVATVDRIIGCPHEEGIDYPEGHTCPECPFWENRDRWTGEMNDSQLIN
jgi:hypothetical protein